ncbi:MAG: SAM-dependent methyltransferase [Pseudomonadota bacterium]
MSPLEELIRAEIRATGPMTVARYMEMCLAHPEHGYYATRDPLGVAGDFTTAPEISQMFGEMIGVWVASVAPADSFRLIELGPGRGTLMADVLRVLEQAEMRPEVWLVETSPALRAEQAIRVPNAHWADRLEQVPDGPAVILANEFLDALPVHQYLRAADGWRERLVGLRDGRLTWGLSEPLPGRDAAPEGAWTEKSPQADAALEQLAARLGASPGAALIVDYGYTALDRPNGPTLQAAKDHAYADALEGPGEADLTWLVNFDRAATALGGQVTTQGAFLAAMGIGARAQALASASPEEAGAVADALERLTAPEQMGTLFKVLGAVSPGLPAPPGFGD